MEDSLYKPTDPVLQLINKNFKQDKTGCIILDKSVFKGPGIIKAYAPWCPYCSNKVDKINRLATLLNKQFNDQTVRMYTFNANNAPIAQAIPAGSKEPLIPGYPSFLQVDPERVVTRLKDIHSPSDAITKFCSSYPSLCTTNPTTQTGGGKKKSNPLLPGLFKSSNLTFNWDMDSNKGDQAVEKAFR